MVNGASPNVVHSLDAAALHETVVRANKNHGIYDFSFIHDSYGTHSNKCDELSSTLREVFVDFFSRDLLNEWRTQLTEQHPDLDFPVPPEFGDAEINKIKESTYFFS
jgi:DNA-directed RNA polymerase